MNATPRRACRVGESTASMTDRCKPREGVAFSRGVNLRHHAGAVDARGEELGDVLLDRSARPSPNLHIAEVACPCRCQRSHAMTTGDLVGD